MPASLVPCRVFIASPSCLEVEREAVRAKIDEYNKVEAIPRGVCFVAVCWEDANATAGRSQEALNELVRSADIFLLMLWKRWGSPPDAKSNRFSSGTEEEFGVAMDCLADPGRPMSDIAIMFKALDQEEMIDPDPQLQKVLEFKRRIEDEKTHHYVTFDSVLSFQYKVWRHLAGWLMRYEQAGRFGRGEVSTQDSLSPKSPFDIDGATASTKEAWALANNGRLTSAEVEFARLAVGNSDPDEIVQYGQFLFRIGRVAQAHAVVNKALSIAKDSKDLRSVMSAYSTLGMLYEAKGEMDEALKLHKQSLHSAQELGDRRSAALAEGNIGMIHRRRGDLTAAEKHLSSSLAVAREIGDEFGMANALGNLANIARQRGQFDQAESMYNEAQRLSMKTGDEIGVATSYQNLAGLKAERNDLTGADILYQKAFDACTKLGHSDGLARCFIGFGALQTARGDFPRATRAYNEALQLYRTTGNPQGRADVLGKLAIVASKRGDFESAKQLHLEAVRLKEGLQDIHGLATEYCNLGIVYYKCGDIAMAESTFERGLKLNREVEDRAGSATILVNLGKLLAATDRSREAEAMLNEALSTCDELRMLEGGALAATSLGVLFAEQKDWDRALEFFRRALDRATKLGSRGMMAGLRGNIERLEADHRGETSN